MSDPTRRTLRTMTAAGFSSPLEVSCRTYHGCPR